MSCMEMKYYHHRDTMIIVFYHSRITRYRDSALSEDHMIPMLMYYYAVHI